MTVNDAAVIWVVLSDIHANLPALAAVCRDARRQAQAVGASVDQLRYISLGDVVDYGPDPVICLNWVNERCAVKIRGNHDLEASKCPRDRVGEHIAKAWWPGLVWTRCQLTERQRLALQQWERRGVIPGHAEFVLGHANLCGDEEQSLPTFDENGAFGQRLFRELESTGAQYGLVGHSHQQIVLLPGYFPFPPDDSKHQMWQFVRNVGSENGGWPTLVSLLEHFDRARLILNPGSVGQPRRVSQPCAQYLLLDMRENVARYQFRTIGYKHTITTNRLRKNMRLPEKLPNSCAYENNMKLTPEDEKIINNDALSIEVTCLIDLLMGQ